MAIATNQSDGTLLVSEPETEAVVQAASQIAELQTQLDAKTAENDANARERKAAEDHAETLIQERNTAQSDAIKASRLVAAMHKAAVGEVRGPIRGVVEDVEDLRSQLTTAQSQLTTLQGENERLNSQAKTLESNYETLAKSHGDLEKQSFEAQSELKKVQAENTAYEKQIEKLKSDLKKAQS